MKKTLALLTGLFSLSALADFNPYTACDYNPASNEKIYIVARAEETSTVKRSNICIVTDRQNVFKQMRFVKVVDENWRGNPVPARITTGVATPQNIGAFNEELDDVSGLDVPRGIVVTPVHKSVVVRSSDLDDHLGGTAIMNYLHMYNFTESNERHETSFRVQLIGNRWYIKTADGNHIINKLKFIRHSYGVTRVDYEGQRSTSNTTLVRGTLPRL